MHIIRARHDRNTSKDDPSEKALAVVQKPRTSLLTSSAVNSLLAQEAEDEMQASPKFFINLTNRQKE
jgi:hypothetical protein